MRSHVKLLQKPLSVINCPIDQRSALTQLPLKLAEACYVTLEKSDILVQSIRHHLFYFQCYDYKVKTNFEIDFEITENSFFMLAIQESSSILYNHSGDILSEMSGDSCRLAYLKAGKYKRSLSAGNYRVVLLTIRPEWLISKYGELEELSELISSFKNGVLESYSLPGFNIAAQLFNSLRKLNTLSERRDAEIDLYIFLNDCIRRYMLKVSQGLVNVKYQEGKAKEIADFVTKNYASKVVGDETGLADRFMMSKTMLVRLAKLAFDRPLHQQVIELRMHHGLKMLLTTQTTVREISASVGYGDPKYFSRAFKKRFGIAPNETRVTVR
ncbi:helix-turn-helix transcriptional regulator [Pedobacter sp. PLR]|uniref:helix-turn-helix transcriptional regulator n=1 Tax=Pedobacter sp. PLR TaxID=2994465 RepID=UPI0022461476|nr:helix-turn-helix transcriptional regulator [Pedobacter sp. PLR]MCX2449936.1 helix-turn-helix transcriptional regulator [Pedobacter sp. PLR]